jgi:outer membrane immunogenic protein
MQTESKGQGANMTIKLMRSTIAAAALAATSLAAQAADIPVKVPIYKQPIYSWTGFYAGVNAGYGWRDPSIDFGGNSTAELLFAAGYLPRFLTVDPRGALGGLQAGYNWQSGALVYGIEADLDRASIKGSASASGAPFTFDCEPFLCPAIGTFSAEQKLDWLGTVRGRIGFLPAPAALFYLTGGLAYGHAQLAASVNSVPTMASNAQGFFVCQSAAGLPGANLPPCGSGSTSAWLAGWTLGGGLEYALGAQWSVKGEYLYYDLGSLSVFFAAPGTTSAFTATAEFKGHIARVGVNHRF